MRSFCSDDGAVMFSLEGKKCSVSALNLLLNLFRCAAAYVLLAEEEATTIIEAERLFKQALKFGMSSTRAYTRLFSHGPCDSFASNNF